MSTHVKKPENVKKSQICLGAYKWSEGTYFLDFDRKFFKIFRYEFLSSTFGFEPLFC